MASGLFAGSVDGDVEPAGPADEGHAQMLVGLLERDDVVEQLRLDVRGDVRLRQLRLHELRELQRGWVAR